MIFKNEGVQKFISESAKMAITNQNEYSLNENIQIYIKDKITSDIDFMDIMKRIDSVVPMHLMSEIDSIFVGIF